MAAATGRVDEFVKDYLAFRGLSTTLKTLESELKNEKEKGFRVCIPPFSDQVFSTQNLTMLHFDALKIYSCGKHCEKRRNCW